jgi:hypothetical protein
MFSNHGAGGADEVAQRRMFSSALVQHWIRRQRGWGIAPLWEPTEPRTNSTRPRTVTPEDVGKFRPAVREGAIEQHGPAATPRTEIDAVLNQLRDHLVQPIHVGM